MRGGTVAKKSVETAEAEENVETISTKRLQKLESKLENLDDRLSRLEKRLKNNERFARTFASALTTQVVAIDAVTEAMRHALRNDVEVHEELALAIKHYDKRKIRRWFSGFFGVLMWIASVGVAGVVGAFIYWLFSGQ